MFPDSEVSSKMELGPGAWSLVPYFKTILKDEILLSDCFVVSFVKA